MMYLPDYRNYVKDYLGEDEDDFEVDKIAEELRDVLEGRSPEDMDYDQFIEVVQKWQR